MVVIADKGFGSDYNFKMMDSCGLKYIVPLRRNSRYFNKDRIGTRDYKGTFLFNDRPVWFFEEIIKDADGNAAGKVVTYLDKDLELREQRDYMSRIASHVDGYTEEGLFERAGKMGVLLIRTNIEADGRNVYEFYKKRAAIEESFDVLKNTLE
ncbi:transposase, partial [Cloacibacillus evryensis]